MPDAPPLPYRLILCWDDEDGERYYLAGHVPARRALAAVNHSVRDSCGRHERNELLGDVLVADVTVDHRWMRPDPQVVTNPDGTTWVDDESYAWCDQNHPDAQAITVVSL